MHRRILLLVTLSLFLFLSSSAWAENGYVGEDLWNDIYKRIDEGTYKLKKQLLENRLKGSTKDLNDRIGMVCSKKEWETTKNILCLREGIDFTTSEFEAVSGGSLGTIIAHINPENISMDTDRLTRIRGIIVEYYGDLYVNVAQEQKKLQSIGSIGLYSDGNKDNSSYDLVTDLENIHSVIFTKDIPYNGTDNLGSSSVENLLADIYKHPFSPVDSLIVSPKVDPGVSLISPATLSGLTLSWLVKDCVKCVNVDQVPLNLDPNFLRDVQSQLLVGVNPNSSMAFSDDGKLPEYWANVARGNGGGSLGGAWEGNDTFPCSGKDFFCILLSMVDYSQNLLGGKTDTIEKILDENLKIANEFAPSSFVQSKMTKMFFGLSLTNLDLPSMLHMGVVVSRLPPPILNLKKWSGEREDDEFNKVLIGTFEELGLDFKRQNSLEKNEESLVVHNCSYLTTDTCSAKQLEIGNTSRKSGYTQTKEMELKKGYGDSFNDDLFELHDFTLAFTKSIKSVTDIIKAMHAIK